MRFKIGDKVVPTQKTAMCSLENCKEWKIGETQGFLYVKGYWEDGYILGAFSSDDNNSIYRFGDVREYMENEDSEGNCLLKGFRLEDLEITPNHFNLKGLHKLIKDKEGILYIGFYDGECEELSLTEVKRLKRYLDRFITYCEGVEK